MPGLLESGPYANYDPEKDPYVRSHAPTPIDPNAVSIPEAVAGIPRMLSGLPEVAATVGTSLVAMPQAGWAGLLMGTTKDENRPKGFYVNGAWEPSLFGTEPMPAASAVDRVMEKGTLMPRSEYGIEAMQGLGGAMETVMSPVTKTVDYGLKEGTKAGLPTWMMAAPLTVATGLAETIPGKRTGSVARRAASNLPENRTAPDPYIGDELRSTTEILAKYDDTLAVKAMMEEGQLGQTGFGRGQRGAIGYHGTPHKFDHPSNEYMGTGEGAQAYGWGHYVAEDQGVASGYKPRDFDAEEVMYSRFREASARNDPASMEIWERAMMHETGDEIRDLYKGADYDDAFRGKANAIADEVDELARNSQAAHLYEYDIPDTDVAQMLDWDAPLSEQPDNVREAMMKQVDARASEGIGNRQSIIDQDPVGSDLYRRMGFGKLGDEAISAKWNELGVPGIRFLDGNSRSAGEGTRNLVLFDPEKSVKSVKRDGETVSLGQTKVGRGQRGSVEDTGAGKGILETQAVRAGILTIPDRQLQAKEFVERPKTVASKDNFNQRLSEARQSMDDQDRLQVDAELPRDFDGTVYTIDDGGAGFAISKDGYISNLYRHPDAEYRGTMQAALTKARAAGAKNLDAFDSYLARGYINRGARETGRYPFDPKNAPDGWDTSRMGQPDYVEMDVGGVIPTQKHSEIIGPRNQGLLDRQATPRGEPPVVADAFKGGKVGRLNRIVDEGLEMGGEKWYYMAGMLDNFIMELGPEMGVKRFDEFMDLNAAVSPRSSVAQQIKRASVLYQRNRRGESITDLTHDMFPPGYGHMATTTAHRPAVNRIVETGAVGDSIAQPKITSYAENLKGNYEPLTSDSHNNLIITGREGSPGGAQYPHLESRQAELAARRDLQPAEWQAALWVGGGDITKVRDVRNFPDAMNQRIARTAEELGIPEKEALIKFMHGDTILYSTMAALFGVELAKTVSGSSEQSGHPPASSQPDHL